MRIKPYLVFVSLFSSFYLNAQLRLPVVFDDHMVIQQQTSVPIWGWANPSENVTINVSWDTTTVKTKASNGTRWRASVNTPAAGGPHTITIKSGNETVILDDVLVGEVWLASGQSNMEWSMQAAGDGRTVIDQVNDPKVRLLNIPKASAGTLQERGEGVWTVCDKETVRGFSAVAYFFGKKLSDELGVPVGLINASWGGSPAEVWMSSELVEENESLRASAAKLNSTQPWSPVKSGVAFNSMINPLIPFRIAGAIWYQGESNTAAPATYKDLMEQLIKDWRNHFQSDIPFYYVQIAPYTGYNGNSGTLIREQQVKMLEIPKTGMVVITDLVDDVNDIHPQYKKPVGERLANVALAQTYNKASAAYQSPLYKSMKVEKNRVRIFFDHADSGLASRDGDPTEFMIAGEDKKFYPAKAKIDKGSIVVSAKEVKNPVAVRFAWGNASIPKLFSREGLPVPSFRTDSWPE